MSQVLEFMLNEGLLSDVSMQIIQNYMKKFNRSAFSAVLECHILEEGELADIISRRMSIDRLFDLSDYNIDFEAMLLLPWTDAVKYNCMPIGFNFEGSAVEVVFSNPTSPDTLTAVEAIIAKKVVPVVAEEKAVRAEISKRYPIEMQLGIS
jgi:hypothetical protein